MKPSKLKTIVAQYIHGSGLLVRTVPTSMLHSIESKKPMEDQTRSEIEKHVRSLIDRECGDEGICLKDIIHPAFFLWAVTPGQARANPTLYIAYNFRANMRWDPVAICTWGTFRQSYLPARQSLALKANKADYDEDVGFSDGDKDLTLWAEEGKIAEVDILCSKQSDRSRNSKSDERYGFKLFLFVLADIASKKRNYKAVCVSVAYNNEHPIVDSKMMKLLKEIGFVDIAVYNKKHHARDSEGKTKEYMILKDEGRKKWYESVEAKISLPETCPKEGGHRVSKCI